jgi:drug/metabolite transporter (DMT)-like permease
MNIPILVASILTFLAFVIHTFVGDKALKIIEPTEETDKNFQKRGVWTMIRCGWHWISFDLLFVTIGLGLINFTDFFDNENTLLKILSVYFLGYAIVWALTIVISKQFPKNYLQLGQWFLMLLISGLIYWGTN